MTALDLFCGGGAVCEGLQRLGFTVTGIDNDPRCAKYYPGTFQLGDATAIDAAEMARFDLVWCSPPCQLFSRASAAASTASANHLDLLTPLRRPLLRQRCAVDHRERAGRADAPGHARQRRAGRAGPDCPGAVVRRAHTCPRSWVQPILTLPGRAMGGG